MNTESTSHSNARRSIRALIALTAATLVSACATHPGPVSGPFLPGPAAPSAASSTVVAPHARTPIGVTEAIPMPVMKGVHVSRDMAIAPAPQGRTITRPCVQPCTFYTRPPQTVGPYCATARHSVGHAHRDEVYHGVYNRHPGFAHARPVRFPPAC